MNPIRNLSFVLFVLLSTVIGVRANDQSPPLAEGDCIAFIGDSITEQMIYSRYVMNYFTLHFPGVNIRFRNRGISGATARFDETSVQQFIDTVKPTVASICFGMNDGAYRKFDQAIYDRYVANMTQWVRALKARKIRVVLLTPGCCDEERRPQLHGFYNDTLERLAQGVKQIAAEEKVAVYDLHRAMRDIYARARRDDPNFTMIPDGVHPNSAGHLPITYGLLKLLGCNRQASSASIDVGAGKVQSRLCIIRDLKSSERELSFQRQDDSLPAWFDAEAAPVFKYCPILEDYNDYRLTVAGLPAGAWQLKVAGKAVGVFHSDALARGVNLAQEPGPWRDLGARINAGAAESSARYFQAWRIFSPRLFPAEAEPERQALVAKLLDSLAAHDRRRCRIDPSERTWAWQFQLVAGTK